MPESMAVTLAAAALLAVLTVAVVSPRRPHESVVAVPAAGLLVLLGVVTPEHALDELRALGPTIGFLAAVLVLAHVSDEEGVFRYAGALVGLACRGHPVSLLRLVCSSPRRS